MWSRANIAIAMCLWLKDIPDTFSIPYIHVGQREALA